MCLIAHDESDFACAHDIIDFMYGLTLALSYLLCLFDNSVDLVDIPAARIAIVYQYTEDECSRPMRPLWNYFYRLLSAFE